MTLRQEDPLITSQHPQNRQRLHIVINQGGLLVIAWAFKMERTMLELLVSLVTAQTFVQDGTLDLEMELVHTSNLLPSIMYPPAL
jgi:type III secretory pathway component EscS